MVENPALLDSYHLVVLTELIVPNFILKFVDLKILTEFKKVRFLSLGFFPQLSEFTGHFQILNR